METPSIFKEMEKLSEKRTTVQAIALLPYVTFMAMAIAESTAVESTAVITQKLRDFRPAGCKISSAIPHAMGTNTGTDKKPYKSRHLFLCVFFIAAAVKSRN